MLVGDAVYRSAPWLLPLRRLGGYHGTNKAGLGNVGLDYLDTYARYLRGLRVKRFALLELGVYRGESLRMWRDYLPRAEIYGLDIDPAAASRAQGFRVFTGSQADASIVASALDEIGSSLRVVVDDASHVTALTIASFDLIFPRLPRGGLYFIEDLGSTYGDRAWREQPWPGRELNAELPEGSRADLDAFVARLLHDLDGQGDGGRTVAFVHAWPLMLVVGRA
jgi:hypothetical protein